MSARIDYRYNAQERIKLAVTHPSERQAQTTALIAQAEATLALVEQQKAANIIALAQLRVLPSELPPFRHLAMRPRDEYDVEPSAFLKEALGL